VILGVEVRDDAVRALAVDDAGSIARFGHREGLSGFVAVDAVRAALNGDRPAAIGIAVRNPHDQSAGELVAAVMAAARTTTAPRVMTRGCAVALGEHWRGAAQGVRHVVTLTSGDSVHSGLVVDGVPFEGAHGLAGLAGWMALNPVEREDYRRFGSLQAEIGAPGIVRRLVWRIKSGDESRVLDLAGGDIDSIRVHHIFEASRAGDGVAISVVRDTTRYIGMAMANLIATTDPEVLVVGGLIADAADQLLHPSRSEAVRWLPKSMAAVTVLPAALGDDAGPLGAARAALIAA
jgi:predicted NBD/HSP70 family sugar kinase